MRKIVNTHKNCDRDLVREGDDDNHLPLKKNIFTKTIYVWTFTRQIWSQNSELKSACRQQKNINLNQTVAMSEGRGLSRSVGRHFHSSVNISTISEFHVFEL